MAAVLVGSTGLVGAHILSTLIASSKFTSIHAYTRKPLQLDSTKVSVIESKESDEWPSKFPSGAAVLFSGLGTTRAQAGGFENQKKLDYNLNLELAKAAKEAGVETYVLISAAGANSSSLSGYSAMKGQLEDDVATLGFKHAIFLRPGLLRGDRGEKSRLGEGQLQSVANIFQKIGGNKLVDWWAQDAEVIARAAVQAAVQAAEGKLNAGVTIFSQADIIKMGRTEWPASE